MLLPINTYNKRRAGEYECLVWAQRSQITKILKFGSSSDMRRFLFKLGSRFHACADLRRESGMLERQTPKHKREINLEIKRTLGRARPRQVPGRRRNAACLCLCCRGDLGGDHTVQSFTSCPVATDTLPGPPAEGRAGERERGTREDGERKRRRRAVAGLLCSTQSTLSHSSVTKPTTAGHEQ